MLGKAIPEKVRAQILARPQVCALSEHHQCEGRLTWEHALYYKGSKINEAFAIILLCAKYHSVDQYQDNGLLDKKRNKWAALGQASDEDIARYSRANFQREKEQLEKRFGKYKAPCKKDSKVL